jgi:general stress protein 26
MTTDPTPAQKIAELAKGIDFAMLTTVDETGTFVSRPMAQRDTDVDGNVWFLSSRDSRKVAHITADPRVGVALTSRDVWVSLTGTAEILEDAEKAAELWSPQMEGWFPQGPEDPSVVVVKVTGETAEYWDTPGGLVASVLSLVKVKTTGERYHGNDNEVVEL